MEDTLFGADQPFASMWGVHPYRQCTRDSPGGNLLARMERIAIIGVLSPRNSDDRTIPPWPGSLLDRRQNVW